MDLRLAILSVLHDVSPLVTEVATAALKRCATVVTDREG